MDVGWGARLLLYSRNRSRRRRCAKIFSASGATDDKTCKLSRMQSALLVLDIDGVLSTPKTQVAGGMTNFSLVAVVAMQRLVAQVSFDVLLCSSWRVDQRELMSRALHAAGLGGLTQRLRGSTPVFDAWEVVSRGQEIDAWLYRSGYRGRLAILDDEDPLPELRNWWLPVNQEIGLTFELASTAARLLRAGPVYSAAD